MAPASSKKGTNRLRVVTQRISVTPTWQLPHIVRNLAVLISESDSQLCSANRDGSKHGSDHVSLVHKYKTQVSTLLQDRSPRARFAAAVLVKATIEAGDTELLKASGRWVGSLISILGKSDSPPTKKICLFSVTRIFTLSHQDQQIVREITTPALPGFITACLKVLANAEDVDLSTTIIQALLELLPRHPASFRPFVAQLQSLLSPYIASTPSSLTHGSRGEEALPFVTESLVHECRLLYIRLTSCAAKDKSGEEWTKLLNTTIREVHFTCDRVFRAFVEDWSRADYLRSHARDHDPGDLAQVAQSSINTTLILPAWRGIEAGLERLEGLLKLLQCFLISATSSVVAFSMGFILDIIWRILSIAALEDQVNLAIDRNEREVLRLSLPSIQSCTLDLSTLLIRRLGYSSASFVLGLIELMFMTPVKFWSSDVWHKAYARSLTQVLYLFGPSMPSYLSTPFSKDISIFCNEAFASTNSDRIKLSQNHAAGFTRTNSMITRDDEVLVLARSALLCLPNTYLTGPARKSLERFAILTGDKDALLAATLNPHTKQKARRQAPSLLPFLAQEHQHAPEVEALIRPRMVPMKGNSGSLDQAYGEMQDELQLNEYDMAYGQISPVNEPDGAMNIEEPIRYPHQDTDTRPEPQASSFPNCPPSSTEDVEKHIETPETEPLHKPASPLKRPYEESLGGYTLYTPSEKSALGKLDALDDEPWDAARPAVKKPRLEEQPAEPEPEPEPESEPQIGETGSKATENPSVTIKDGSIESSMRAPRGDDAPLKVIDKVENPGNESEDSPIPTIYTSSDEEDDNAAMYDLQDQLDAEDFES